MFVSRSVVYIYIHPIVRLPKNRTLTKYRRLSNTPATDDVLSSGEDEAHIEEEEGGDISTTNALQQEPDNTLGKGEVERVRPAGSLERSYPNTGQGQGASLPPCE